MSVHVHFTSFSLRRLSHLIRISKIIWVENVKCHKSKITWLKLQLERYFSILCSFVRSFVTDDKIYDEFTSLLTFFRHFRKHCFFFAIVVYDGIVWEYMTFKHFSFDGVVVIIVLKLLCKWCSLDANDLVAIYACKLRWHAKQFLSASRLQLCGSK